MRTDVVAALRQLSGTYIRERRASGALRSRIVAVAHERSRVLRGAELVARTELTQRQLADTEDTRIALERSARDADDRLRAVEAVIASVVRETAALPIAPAAAEAAPAREQVAPASVPVRAPHPSRLAPKQPREASRKPEEPVRGGWTRPGPGN